MSAAARAEARRKAILSRGTDRLAKLTTSGRGEDNPAYVRELTPDPPLPSFPSSTSASPSRNLSNFVGEETVGMPPLRPAEHFPAPNSRPRSRVPSNAQTPANPFGMPDPGAWGQDQQQQFLAALMGGAGNPAGAANGVRGGGQDVMDPFAGMGIDENNPFAGMGPNNPFAAMMAAAAGGGGAGGFPPMGAGAEGMGDMGAGMAGLSSMMGMGAGKTPGVAPPKTRAQRLMPALHLVAVWSLLLYFVLVREPAAHIGAAVASGAEGPSGLGFAWRWRQLAGGPKSELGSFAKGWGVQVVPFFWAFVTLELVLHSLRIFSGFDAFRPPTLLALALPHLPPPLPAVIVHSMKYLQMGSLFLDDVAAVVVAIGLVIWFSTWRAT